MRILPILSVPLLLIGLSACSSSLSEADRALLEQTGQAAMAAQSDAARAAEAAEAAEARASEAAQLAQRAADDAEAAKTSADRMFTTSLKK